MATISFSLDAISASQNPWERAHWSKRSQDKEMWFWMVRNIVGVVEKEEKQKHLHIIRVGKRLIDDQNVPAGCKYLVDALVTFGHLYADSRKWTRVTFDQRKCMKDEQPHMEVTLQDWDGC